ncbi:MAG: hypothetical protein WCO10_02930 [bacterium]
MSKWLIFSVVGTRMNIGNSNINQTILFQKEISLSSAKTLTKYIFKINNKASSITIIDQKNIYISLFVLVHNTISIVDQRAKIIDIINTNFPANFLFLEITNIPIIKAATAAGICE